MTTETTTMAMPMAKPETVYVKGSVTGELPPPGATLRGVTGVITSYTIYDSTNTSVMPVMTDTIAETMATPADGPSLGVAPSGTCTWMSFLSKDGGSIPKATARMRT